MKEQKGSFVIGWTIIIIGLIFIILNAFYFWLHYLPLASKSRAPSKILSKSSELNIDTFAPVLNEVEGWKTYRNEKYGFEVRYPIADFRITDGSLQQYPSPATNIVFIKRIAGEERLQIQVLEHRAPDPEHYRPNLADFIEKVMIGGEEAFKYHTERPGGEGGYKMAEYPFTEYLVILGDRRYMIINYFGGDEIDDVFEKILSTFKFIPSTSLLDGQAGSGQVK